jgi:ribosomal protein S18 acetylase RimI-like enzyme
MTLSILPATPQDLPDLHRVIERAYRGDTARKGWTHEADMLDDQRTDLETLSAILGTPGELLLVARSDDTIRGCVQLTDKGEGLAYLGLLCIDPEHQAGGLGRQLLAEAEARAARHFAATRMEMSAISVRTELIAYYQRRGYHPTGEQRPFPVEVEPPLWLAVLEKRLDSAHGPPEQGAASPPARHKAMPRGKWSADELKRSKADHIQPIRRT